MCIHSKRYGLWKKSANKIAVPVVPTIRLLITFTKFEELQPADEFSTPLSSPTHMQDAKLRIQIGLLPGFHE